MKFTFFCHVTNKFEKNWLKFPKILYVILNIIVSMLLCSHSKTSDDKIISDLSMAILNTGEYFIIHDLYNEFSSFLTSYYDRTENIFLIEIGTRNIKLLYI